MTVKERLIVLTYTKIKDSAIVIHTISRSEGRRSFLVHLGKRSSLALFQPLSILEAEIRDNAKSELATATGFSAIFPLESLRTDPRKNAMVMFMAEVLYRSIRDGSGETFFYDWCEKSIVTLDFLKSDFSNYHILFLIELAREMGFAPTAAGIAPLAGTAYQDARELIILPFPEAMTLPLTGKRRSELCDVFIRYIAHHSESTLEIRSLGVLRELF